MDHIFAALNVSPVSDINVDELRKQIAENFRKIDQNIQELQDISGKIPENHE